MKFQSVVFVASGLLSGRQDPTPIIACVYQNSMKNGEILSAIKRILLQKFSSISPTLFSFIKQWQWNRILRLGYYLYLSKTAVEIAVYNHKIIAASEVKIPDWPLRLVDPIQSDFVPEIELTSTHTKEGRRGRERFPTSTPKGSLHLGVYLFICLFFSFLVQIPDPLTKVLNQDL